MLNITIIKISNFRDVRRGREDVFSIRAVNLAPVEHVLIGHDDNGAAPGWYLEKVVVECPSSGIAQTFLCRKWLSRDEGNYLNNTSNFTLTIS